MGLLRQRPVRHGAGGEPPDDRRRRLDLVERDRLGRAGTSSSRSWSSTSGAVVGQLGERVVALGRLGADGRLQQVGREHLAVLAVVALLLHERQVVERLDGVLVLGVGLAALAHPEEARRLEVGRLAPAGGVAGAARRRRARCQPMPPTTLGVPVKHTSTTSGARPTTSKIWAPRYESTVQMPILDRILSTPASTAAWKRLWASGLVRSSSSDPVGLGGHRGQRQPGADGVGAVAEQGGEAVHVEDVVGHHHERRSSTAGAGRPGPGAPRRVASSDGTGARSAPTSHVVEDQRCRRRPSTAATASSTRRSTAAAQAVGPLGHRERGVERDDRPRRLVAQLEVVDAGGEEEERRQGRAARPPRPTR